MIPDQDAERFAELLRVVGEFYDTNVSPMRATIFFGALQQYEWPIVQEAFNRFLQSEASKFGFPKPIHIREIIEGTESERDANVWLALEEAVRKIGVWQSLIVADPALADAVIRVWGSWINCCEFRSHSDNILWNAKRKDFVAAYRIALKNPRVSRDPVLLMGYCDAQNRQSGHTLKRAYYGAILLDGKVETRYLDVNAETGLPLMPLPDALALPPAKTRLALQAAPDPGRELTPEESRAALEETMKAVGERVRAFPRAYMIDRKTVVFDPTQDDTEERRAQVKRHAEERHASESPIAASEPVRSEESPATGQSVRASDTRGEHPEAGAGVPVRDVDRAEVGGGSGVAGVPDPVRTGRRGVRERGSRRDGSVHGPEGTARPARTGNDRKTRRKA